MKYSPKAVILIIIVAVLAMGIPLANSCTTPSTPEVTPDQPVRLVYHFPFADATHTGVVSWYMDEVERRTNGRVEFQRLFGGALGSLEEQPLNIKERVFDLGNITPVYSPGVLKVMYIDSLPFLTEDHRAMNLACWDLMNTKEVEEELAGLNQKGLINYVCENMMIMSHVEATNVDDLKPYKIRGHGGAAGAMASAGLTSVAIGWGELPTALERRVVDAAVVPVPCSSRDVGFHEICDYVLLVTAYYFPYCLSINLDVWNDLPKDIQDTMWEVSQETANKNADLFEGYIADAWEDFDDAGVERVSWSADAIAEFKEMGGRPVWQDYVNQLDDAGYDGQKLLDDFQDMIERHGG